MKKTTVLLCSIFLVTATLLPAQETPTPEYTDAYNKLMQRTEWWRNDRFGMFIHFGAYAVAARGEWVKSNEQLNHRTVPAICGCV